MNYIIKNLLIIKGLKYFASQNLIYFLCADN